MHTRRLLIALFVTALAACTDDKSAVDDTGPGPAIDLDRDGFGEDVDCDDQSAGVYPGATERCNGLDDDCDGTTDEPGAVDGVPGYVDADGDGWGDSTASTVCPGTTDTISVGGDCDDGDSAVSPSATELCDGVDNDCDSLTDEPGTPDGTEYHLDQDGDGYGHPIQTGIACAEGDGYTTDASDCDDQDPARSPAQAELCNNEQDDDCDGVIDESDDAAAPSWYPDGDGDGYGVDGVTVASCDQPEGYADNNEDCDDTDSAISPGDRENSEDGLDNDCDGEVDEAGWSGSGELVLEGYFVSGLYGADEEDWQCMNVYNMSAFDMTDESACDGCNYSFAAVSTYEEGLSSIFGYRDCEWTDYTTWSGPDEFTTYWSFNSRAESAYYLYAGEWVYWTYASGSPSDGYMQWVFFFDTTTDPYEIGLFWSYSDYYGYPDTGYTDYGYDDGPDTGR